MDLIQAKNKILSLYKEGGIAYEKVRKEEYKQMYYAVLSHLNKGNDDWRNAVGSFLLHGALRYDRYLTSRPKVDDEESYDMFCRFLNTLQKMDGKYIGRTAFLHLEKIRWDVYRACSAMPCDDEMKTMLAECENEARKIILNEGEVRVIDNINKKKEELLELISSIKDGNVRTEIHTTLPYMLTDTDATVVMDVDGVKVEVAIKNQSQGSSIPIAEIAEGTTMSTAGPSKWTTTTCEMDITAHCLIDPLEERERVTLRRDEEKGYWNAVYDFTYRVVTQIWGYLQKHDELAGMWPPLPNDIHYIDSKVLVNGRKIDGEFATNPALVYRVTSLKKEAKRYEIEEKETCWSDYAYMLAKVYGETGQLKEAVFWVNVAMEALAEEFIRRTAKTEEDLAEIEGMTYKFDTAEEILSEQFPEMKGKVNWPKSEIHTSLFTKLKRAVNKSELKGMHKEIREKYAQVNAKRNALFHGGDVEIDVEDVEKAFGAFEWLREKMS
jgi:hypothetical protein